MQSHECVVERLICNINIATAWVAAGSMLVEVKGLSGERILLEISSSWRRTAVAIAETTGVTTCASKGPENYRTFQWQWSIVRYRSP